jgi:myosin heavy subunit
MQGQMSSTRTFAGDAASLFFSGAAGQTSPPQPRKSGFARYLTPNYVPAEQNGDAEVIAAQLLKDSELRDKIKRLEFQVEEQQRTITQLKAESVRVAELKKTEEEEAQIKMALDAEVAVSALGAVIQSKRSEVETALHDVAQEIEMTVRSIEVHEQMLEKAPSEDRTYYQQTLSQKRAQLTALRRKDAMLNQKHSLMLLATGAAGEDFDSDNDSVAASSHVRDEDPNSTAAVQSHWLQSISEGSPRAERVGEGLEGTTCRCAACACACC